MTISKCFKFQLDPSWNLMISHVILLMDKIRSWHSNGIHRYPIAISWFLVDPKKLAVFLMYQQYVSNSLQDWPPWCPDFGGCVAWQMVLVPPMINGIHELFNNSRWIQGDTDTLLVNQHRLENATLFLKMYLLLKLQNVFWCQVSEDFVVSAYGSLNLTNRTAEVESMLFLSTRFFRRVWHGGLDF